MAFWRMAFRVGPKGPSMWDHCFRFGVAAITYNALARTDLTKRPLGEPRRLWDRLKAIQKANLKRVAYDMNAGDVIYVKEGPTIINRGRVKGKRGSRAYKFDRTERFKDLNGIPWKHQVPVEWSIDFPAVPILVGSNQQLVESP